MCENLEQKKTAALLRKLQNKLRKQRQDLERTHEYNLQQRLKEQSDRYQSELLKQKEFHQEELQSLKKELETFHQNQVTEKQNEITIIQQEWQKKYEDLQQINDKLTSQIQELQHNNSQLQSQCDDSVQQRHALAERVNDGAANIKHDALQWIAAQQSHDISCLKQPDFQQIETKIFNIDKKAKEFMQKQFDLWNKGNENHDFLQCIKEIEEDNNQMMNEMMHKLDETDDTLAKHQECIASLQMELQNNEP